jgi:hypothetical protein
MGFIKFLSLSLFFGVLAGCTNLDCKSVDGEVLSGTDTAVVGLYFDGSLYPQASVEKVTVRPGQKIIFVGPDKFDIFFKDQRSPTGRLENPSGNGIVIIPIPKDIFERDQRESKSRDIKKELLYRYGIRANGRVTDPTIRVVPY